MNLKDLTVFIFDSGCYTSLADRLTREFKKVYYFSQWESNGFPMSKFDMVGTGIEGVERVSSWLPYINKADLFVFPDVYYVQEQLYLKSLGKNVWGSGETSWMELDRFKLREWEEKNDMPTPETTEYEGVENLSKGIKDNEFIKIS